MGRTETPSAPSLRRPGIGTVPFALFALSLALDAVHLLSLEIVAAVLSYWALSLGVLAVLLLIPLWTQQLLGARDRMRSLRLLSAGAAAALECANLGARLGTPEVAEHALLPCLLPLAAALLGLMALQWPAHGLRMRAAAARRSEPVNLHRL